MAFECEARDSRRAYGRRPLGLPIQHRHLRLRPAGHPSCYDELETYFIVYEAMQQLDDNDSGSVMDFKRLLEQDIRKSRRYIRKKKLGRFSVGVLLCILIVALAAFMVYVVMQMIRII